MLMTRYLHSLVLIALLFAVIGQSFAAADLPCKMMMQHMSSAAHQHSLQQTLSGHDTLHRISPSQNSAHQSGDDDMHAHHAIQSGMSAMMMGMENSSDKDCCKTQCGCPPSGCVPFALALFNNKLLFNVTPYTQPRFYLTAFIDSPIHSLYKPPIFA
ncbi:hypothetical protein PCIT_b0197 [Pseudoalteromonas citrea]|uniref:CopL family metal-binding regulatory protein n=3 Tax=Pseudoalteromonas citrea TaxID=43655 RepID=A0AAD4FPP5_9GAMM|nr:hypothetical protein PCIT_b0197 [Pseudoalteromonas citrea]